MQYNAHLRNAARPLVYVHVYGAVVEKNTIPLLFKQTAGMMKALWFGELSLIALHISLARVNVFTTFNIKIFMHLNKTMQASIQHMWQQSSWHVTTSLFFLSPLCHQIFDPLSTYVDMIFWATIIRSCQLPGTKLWLFDHFQFSLILGSNHQT